MKITVSAVFLMYLINAYVGRSNGYGYYSSGGRTIVKYNNNIYPNRDIPELAHMYCSYCQAKGWMVCVERFCESRFIPFTSYVYGSRADLALLQQTVIDICTYCRTSKIWDCVYLFCYGIPMHVRHYTTNTHSTHSGRHSQSYYGHLAG
ncbi:uncharacterized protein LOC128224643 [Mya arenaria]|uniref:uncharacterized protein LOC128224643 n=1 Tax=Mya arenaria TaxID=6604 RepID=UPI0022E0A5B2|nr:uncharacterized protein LOC128224643 [Mya arenaria]